ncbi:MAG: hypothetical protein KJO43_10175, partial [Phycisphaerae bacterium]|nr:hypothetical protein [Phycisphaerae bacterium]
PITRGQRFEAADASTFGTVLPALVDYRGDVTIVCRGSRPDTHGYLFDLAHRDDPARVALRVLPADGGAALGIPLAEVTAIEVTGRDTAEGKSFERWIQRYVEKKRKGEAASIESEAL